ncbi:MAG: hypothetical protein M3N97_10130 [Pseudomonadota bacterium]|nr:hypothetical protein [Pseudomonadota bacterium]
MDEDAWDDLLSFIEERRVIPIIGPELLQVSTDTGPRLLYDWLAEKLAARLSVDTSQLPRPYTLNDVVCWFFRREQAEVNTMLALAVNGQHRSAEAQALIGPIVKFHRQLAAHNQGDQQQHVELARTLYAQAVIDPTHRVVSLREAASLLDSLPAPMHGLRSVRLWRERVRDAQRTTPARQARHPPLGDQDPQGQGPAVPLRLAAAGGMG